MKLILSDDGLFNLNHVEFFKEYTDVVDSWRDEVLICLPLTDIWYTAWIFIILQFLDYGYNGWPKHAGEQKLSSV